MWRSSVHVGRCGWSPRGSHDLLSRMCVSEKGGAGRRGCVEIPRCPFSVELFSAAFVFSALTKPYLHLVRGKWRVTYPPPPPRCRAIRWRANRTICRLATVATRSGRTRRDPRTVDAATRSRRRRRSPTTAVRGPYRYRKTEPDRTTARGSKWRVRFGSVVRLDLTGVLY